MELLTLEETYAIFHKEFPDSPIEILESRPSYVKVRTPSERKKFLRPGDSIAGPVLMGFADVAMYVPYDYQSGGNRVSFSHFELQHDFSQTGYAWRDGC